MTRTVGKIVIRKTSRGFRVTSFRDTFSMPNEQTVSGSLRAATAYVVRNYTSCPVSLTADCHWHDISGIVFGNNDEPPKPDLKQELDVWFKRLAQKHYDNDLGVPRKGETGLTRDEWVSSDVAKMLAEYDEGLEGAKQ